MSKIAIFASGNGSNAAHILSFFQDKEMGVEVAGVYTNKEKAGIHNVASRFNVPIRVFSNQAFSEANVITQTLQADEIEWIVLAGFLRKIEGSLLKEYTNRIINIHPSLLPKYGGKGMYGNKVHEAVLKGGEEESGISIHLVNEEFDKGELLFQASCKIEKGQTVEELREKIQNLEHRYFPDVIRQTILKNSNEN